MAIESDYLLVDFRKYCRTCKHRDVLETDEPCNECLENPTNLYSHKPVNYAAADRKKKEKKTNENH